MRNPKQASIMIGEVVTEGKDVDEAMVEAAIRRAPGLSAPESEG
jgi:hypothetical protein